MGITTEEQNTVQVIATTTSLMSICGSTAIIVTLLRRKKQSGLLRLSTTDRLVLVMSILDIVASCFFGLGELPYVAGGSDGGFCQFQGFMIQIFSLSTVFWNSCMAHNLYNWVVLKKDLASLSSNLKYYIAVSVGMPFCFAVGLIAGQKLGFASLWCWIEGNTGSLRFTCFYMFVVMAWIYNLFVFLRVSYAIRHRMKKGGMSGNSAIAIAQNAVRRKMTQYLLIFFIIWFFGLLNRTIQDLSGTTVFWALVLHVLFVPMQGFLNAVVYGGLFETKVFLDISEYIYNSPPVAFVSNRCCSKDSRCFKNGPLASLLQNAAPSFTRSFEGPQSRGAYNAKAKKVSKSLFISTYNLAEKPLGDLGDLSRWIPAGYDLYAIGVQECMCLNELRDELWKYLGGHQAYRMFIAEIGSTNTALGFHGMIAVTIFARAADVDSGAFFMPESNATEIKKGADLIVTKAPNKGAVGLPFIYHDTSMAFFTGHFAANSKGRNRLKNRLDDSRDTLTKAVLTADDIGFDAHLTHHFVFVFGDLNFRCGSSPENVLSLISKACKLERDAYWGAAQGWTKKAYALLDVGKECKRIPKAAADAWASVLSLDELQMAMGHNEIFSNFDEPGGGLPQFPPSFRRKMGDEGACGDYVDVPQLLNAFTTNVNEKKANKDDKKAKDAPEEEPVGVDLAPRSTTVKESIEAKLKLGERIPSYTDRILFHALPDKKCDITPLAYELCDEMTGSDHRPVSGSFKFLVNDMIRRGGTAADTTEDDDAEVSESRTLYQSTDGTRGKNQGTKCTFRFHANKFQAVEANFAEKAEEVVVVFPLPTEDPLVEERRVHALAKAIGGAGAGGRKVAFQAKRASDVEYVEIAHLMNNERKVAWKKCQRVHGEGIKMISECRPELGVHALIKLNDKNGACLGQGVVSFGDYMTKVTDGETCTFRPQVDMGMGGKKLGVMECSIDLVELWAMTSLTNAADNIV